MFAQRRRRPYAGYMPTRGRYATLPGNTRAYRHRLGTRRQVMGGYAHRTSGGLMPRDIARNPYGRLVSRRRSDLARRQGHLGAYLGRSAMNPLYRLGYIRR